MMLNSWSMQYLYDALVGRFVGLGLGSPISQPKQNLRVWAWALEWAFLSFFLHKVLR
jgi:hypothetical protein